MNYEFWKKAGVATAVLGTVAIAGTVLASDAVPLNANKQNANGRPVMGMMIGRGERGMINNEAVQTAITNRDYDAFVAAITPENGQQPKILETITADNFSRFCDMHDALKNQDFETAKSIAEELGLPEIGMRGPGQGVKLTHEERQAIRDAVINGDYQTWFNLVAKDGELPERWQSINADNFARFSEMHKLLDQANDIREELGLQRPNQGRGMPHPRQGMGEQNGMRRGWDNNQQNQQ